MLGWSARRCAFCRRVWASVYAGACGSVGAFCPRFTPVFFPLSGKKRRLVIACVPIPPGRDRHSCVLAALFSYRPWLVYFGFVRFFMAISTGYRRTGNGGAGLAARPLCAFAWAHWFCNAFRWEYAGATRPRLRQRVFDSLDSLHAAAGLCWCEYAALVRLCTIALALLCFPRGVRWGCAPQTCAKESSTLWTLFTLRRGYVCAYTRRRRPGTRKDPPGSDLWPGGSCCIKMLSVRSIVQTRAAPKRRRVGLRARSGASAGTAGRNYLVPKRRSPASPRPGTM